MTSRARSTAPQLLDSPENSPRPSQRATGVPAKFASPRLRDSADELQDETTAGEFDDPGEDVLECDDPLKPNDTSYGSFVFQKALPGATRPRGRRAQDHGPVQHYSGNGGSGGGGGAHTNATLATDGDGAGKGGSRATPSSPPGARPRAASHFATDSFDDCVLAGERQLNENWSVAKRFGFPCSMHGFVVEAELQHYNRMVEQAPAWEEKWNLALRGVQLLSNATPEGCEPLRKLARKLGIPNHLRPVVWLTLSGVALKIEENPSFCSVLLQRHGYIGGEPEQTITKDLERTFPDHPFFNLREIGSIKLKHVLHSLCWRNPLLNYCQSFNFLAAVLLLILDDEEAVFWAMVHILENLLPNDYYSEGLLGLKTDQEVTAHLLWDHMPKLAQHFQACFFDVRTLVPAWVMCLYVNVFPIETTVRVWDYLVTHDHRHGMPATPVTILLAVLKIHHDDLLRLQDSSDILVSLGRWAQVMYDGNRLAKVAHEFKVTPGQMFQLRRLHRAGIVAENNERLARKQALLSERTRGEEAAGTAVTAGATAGGAHFVNGDASPLPGDGDAAVGTPNSPAPSAGGAMQSSAVPSTGFLGSLNLFSPQTPASPQHQPQAHYDPSMSNSSNSNGAQARHSSVFTETAHAVEMRDL